MRYLICIISLLLCCASARAATRAAAVIDDGYAGKVLQKILSAYSGSVSKAVQVKLFLDGDGKYLQCKTVTGDGSRLCQAAKAAAPYGTPPYGVSTEILLALSDGQTSKSQASETGPAPKAAPAQTGNYSKYLSRIRRDLRNSMYIPEKTRPGTYHVTVRIKYDSAGKILESSIAQGSGDALLDRYVLQGIGRAGHIETPPKGLPNPLDLTFTLVR